MDTARIKGIDPPVHIAAQELRGWDPGEVGTTEFSCAGCAADVYARCYEPNRKYQAHFALYRDRPPHDAGCPIDPATAAADSGADPAADEIPTVVPWPTRLIDPPTERKVVDPDAGLTPATDRRTSTRSAAARAGGGRPASQSARAYSIRPFADAFIRMDVDQRRREPIVLPGLTDASCYLFAFKRLRAIMRFDHPRRVFYGQLRFTADVEDTGSEYRIALHAGDWDNDRDRFQRTWELRVDHTDWSNRGRALFRDELESAVNQAREEKKEPWFYALATQNTEDPGVIETRARHHVAFIPRDPRAARRRSGGK